DSAEAWGDFNWAKATPTDSAAAGSAMASGTKIYNGALNIDADGNELQTMSQLAHDTGRSAGVVASVQYNHATPASSAVGNPSRSAYLAIGDAMLDAERLDVVTGARHPVDDDDGERRAASYDHIAESS